MGWLGGRGEGEAQKNWFFYSDYFFFFKQTETTENTKNKHPAISLKPASLHEQIKLKIFVEIRPAMAQDRLRNAEDSHQMALQTSKGHLSASAARVKPTKQHPEAKNQANKRPQKKRESQKEPHRISKTRLLRICGHSVNHQRRELHWILKLQV